MSLSFKKLQQVSGLTDTGSGAQQYHVHKSYIWLGSFQKGFLIGFTVFLSSLSGIVQGVTLLSSAATGGFLFGIILALVFIAIVVLVTAITFVYSIVSYKYLYYEFREEEFMLQKGIFNKVCVHVPYSRVQSVNQSAGLLKRAVGVCDVTIDTAGGMQNKGVAVPFLTKEQAEIIRKELFARKEFVAQKAKGIIAPDVMLPNSILTGSVAGGSNASSEGNNVQGAPWGAPMGVSTDVQAGTLVEGAQPQGNVLDKIDVWEKTNGIFGGASVDLGAVTFESGLSTKQVLFSALASNNTFRSIISVLCAILLLVVNMTTQITPPSSWGDQALIGLLQLFGGSYIALIAVLILFLIVVGWIVNLLRTLLSFGSFKVRRRGSRIEVERGLTQHVVDGIDVDRVQNIRIRQGFIFRLLGYCSVYFGKIESGNQGDGTNQNNQAQNSGYGLLVHPFIKMSEVPALLQALIPEYADTPSQLLPVAPCALRRAIIRRGFILSVPWWCVVATAITQIILALNPAVGSGSEALFALIALIVYVIGGVYEAYAIVNAVLWARGSAYGYNKRFMIIRNGGFTVDTTCFLRSKIQYSEVSQNPFQRRVHTATLVASIAAGIGGTNVSLRDVTEEQARQWEAWIKPAR